MQYTLHYGDTLQIYRDLFTDLYIYIFTQITQKTFAHTLQISDSVCLYLFTELHNYTIYTL